MSFLLFTSKTSTFLQSLTKCFNTNLTWNAVLSHSRTYGRQTASQETTICADLPTFQDHLKFRKEEANRSILVQVQSAQSYRELHTYCSNFGVIKNMLHYATGVEPMHFIIVEFSSESEVKNVFANSTYLEDTHAVPVQSQFLWFRATSKKTGKIKAAKNAQLLIENGNNIFKDLEIQDALRNSSSISEQMHQLHKLTKLNDVGIRLRYLAAKQIEMAVSGMFPSAVALPFGSSVNGCGKMGCDLDLVLKLNNNLPCINEESRLVFHSKAMMGSERSTSQRHMEAIGDILQLFLPGCSQVRRILQARVPIIKFYQQLADIECDLSMYNTSGVHMSDFLHLMGSIDPRVRPLIFTVRKWAAEVGLTSSSPGRWISNFSLTLLVLAFLQTAPLTILPSLNQLVKLAGKDDQIIAEDGLNCTFLRSHQIYLSKHPTDNTDDLSVLLQKFFEFYSSFDFQTKAISLNDGFAITKPDHSPLYIVNPLERGLNVSKNVSLDEVEKFKTEVRNAAWILESLEPKTSTWGLLQLFALKKRNNGNIYSGYNRPPKLIEVSKLFEEEDTIEYKSEEIKRQIHNIKKGTKENIKNLSSNLDLSSQKSGR